jgi:hypothetical protein
MNRVSNRFQVLSPATKVTRKEVRKSAKPSWATKFQGVVDHEQEEEDSFRQKEQQRLAAERRDRLALVFIDYGRIEEEQFRRDVEWWIARYADWVEDNRSATLEELRRQVEQDDW